MERLTERTADGILVKEDFGEDVLRTLYQCYGAEPIPHYANCDEGYCAMEKLAEYEDLEEQGKLLKLPCAVGDTVYTLNTLPSGKKAIGETQTDAFMCALGMLEGRFGKMMFLTLEEAESALKEAEGLRGYWSARGSRSDEGGKGTWQS